MIKRPFVQKAEGLFFYSYGMKNFIIVVLLVLFIGENAYIYMYPETFCQEQKERVDSILGRGDAILNDIKSNAKEAVSTKVDQELDSLAPTSK